jgi:hypothetical protein
LRYIGLPIYAEGCCLCVVQGFWDPLGFTADGDVAAFRRRRSVELKHGRISMLATMGYITPEVAGKFPGFLSPSAGRIHKSAIEFFHERAAMVAVV